MIAEVPFQPEITYTPSPAAEAVVAAIEPVEEPVAEAVAEPVAEPVAEAAVEPEPVALPRTASTLPLVFAGGLTSLLVAMGLGLLRRVS